MRITIKKIYVGNERYCGIRKIENIIKMLNVLVAYIFLLSPFTIDTYECTDIILHLLLWPITMLGRARVHSLALLIETICMVEYPKQNRDHMLLTLSMVLCSLCVHPICFLSFFLSIFAILFKLFSVILSFCFYFYFSCSALSFFHCPLPML